MMSASSSFTRQARRIEDARGEAAFGPAQEQRPLAHRLAVQDHPEQPLLPLLVGQERHFQRVAAAHRPRHLAIALDEGSPVRARRRPEHGRIARLQPQELGGTAGLRRDLRPQLGAACRQGFGRGRLGPRTGRHRLGSAGNEEGQHALRAVEPPVALELGEREIEPARERHRADPRQSVGQPRREVGEAQQQPVAGVLEQERALRQDRVTDADFDEAVAAGVLGRTQRRGGGDDT
jgi:hypothetical protein